MPNKPPQNNLAILGGRPVRTRPFPRWPKATQGEKAALQKVINSNGWGIFRGRKTFELEEQFARYHHARYGIAVSNATLALQVQLQCAAVGRGDEVITTIYTCVSTVTAIINVGAIPVFVDILEKNYCIDPDKIVEKISKRTKAIIAVHLYNSVCEIEAIAAFARKHGLVLIEDAAQVPGSFIHGRGVGTFGQSGSFSFQESKIMSSGEGGMIITNHRNTAILARSYINCGRIRPREKLPRRLMGNNYRMTDFQAAILLEQLSLLRQRNSIRQRSVNYLNARLKGLRGIRIIERSRSVGVQACYYYIFKIDTEIFGCANDFFSRILEAEGIPTRKLFVPLYRDPLFRLNPYDTSEAYIYYRQHRLPKKQFPVAERAAREGIALWHPLLLSPRRDLEYIVSAIRKISLHADKIRSISKKL